MGSESQNGFHSSTAGTVHQECTRDRKIAGFQESFAERPRVRFADADVLHQPCRTWAHCKAPSRTAKGKIPTFKAGAARESEKASRLSFAGAVLRQRNRFTC